jgi:rhodanese-related sulfurtransferase
VTNLRVFVTLLVVAAGCSSTSDPGAKANTEPRPASAEKGIAPGIVDGSAARKLVAAGVKVVDVRTPAEYAAGHVPGAVNIPFDELPQRHAELGAPSTPVLLYCRSGRRTGIATQTLRQKGFTTIYDLQAYDRWGSSGG